MLTAMITEQKDYWSFCFLHCSIFQISNNEQTLDLQPQKNSALMVKIISRCIKIANYDVHLKQDIVGQLYFIKKK